LAEQFADERRGESLKYRARTSAIIIVALAALGAGSMDAPPRENVRYYLFRPPAAPRPTTVIGQMKVYRAEAGETFLDIGRREDLGIGEMELANPGADPWLPGMAPQIVLPTAFVVPESGYRGLVINVPEMRMYYFPGSPGMVATFPLGLGPYDWQTPRGLFRVARKEVDPTWHVPISIQREMERPVAVVPPGPDNPLGKYRFVLSIPGYGIHGTNKPWGVGRYYSHGCIRMYPEDIHWLFDHIDNGHTVEIVYRPIKIGLYGDQIFVEVHHDPYLLLRDVESEAMSQAIRLGVQGRVDRERLAQALLEARGFPVNITKGLGREEARLGGRPSGRARTHETPAGRGGGFKWGS
jgi:L,D-transpeptidase ErfK/SrfK